MTAVILVAAALAVVMAVRTWFAVPPKAVGDRAAQDRAYWEACQSLFRTEREALQSPTIKGRAWLHILLAKAGRYQDTSPYARLRYRALEEERTAAAVELARSCLIDLIAEVDVRPSHDR